MKPVSEVIACVVDHGRFTHVARTLGKQFSKVYYTTPEERDCPLIRECVVGDGFDEIERVDSLWRVRDECDIFVFTDIGFDGEQAALQAMGHAVWGPGRASKLESGKGFFLSTLEDTELPVAPHTVVKGLDNLRAYLKENDEKYIKITKFRGDWETLHWTSYDEMEGTLDSYAVRFGPLKDHVTFYVFDPIDTEIEDGVDAYCVAGQWPKRILHGMEQKDKAFIGTMQDFADLPEEVRKVNEIFGPILNELTDGGALKFSTEVRITKEGESFFIDPTCRFGSPPSQGEMLLIKNWGEIIWHGANGELVEPETEDEFVVQAHVTLDGDRTDWNAFKLDAELDEALKGGFCCRVDDLLCLVPITEYHSAEVGYLCATGKTMQAAIEKLRGLKDKLPSGLRCEFSSLADLLKEIAVAEEAGMEFSDKPIPEPETILAPDA